MHPKMKHIYVGVDTHKKEHTAVIIDCWNEKLDEIKIENIKKDFDKLIAKVSKHINDGLTPVFGLEDVSCAGRPLTIYLLQKKYIVKHVNSNMTYSERKNQAILHKTDSYDAFCCAKVLLNNLNTLPDANPNDVYWALKQLVGRRKSLVDESTKLKNQLHSYLQHNYPMYDKFFSDVSCSVALEFWDKYPSPDRMKGVNEEELYEFLRSKGDKYVKIRVGKIIDLVNAEGYTMTENHEVRNAIIMSVIKQMKFNIEEIAVVELEIEKVMKELGHKLDTIPGVSLVSSAEIVAEIGDVNRFSNSDKLAKYAGIAPVTYSSASKDISLTNRLGNRTLNSSIFCLALRQIYAGTKGDKPRNPVFYEYYNKKISEGKTKKQAIKCIMRRLIDIIYAMMKKKTVYIMPVMPKKKAV